MTSFETNWNLLGDGYFSILFKWKRINLELSSNWNFKCKSKFYGYWTIGLVFFQPPSAAASLSVFSRFRENFFLLFGHNLFHSSLDFLLWKIETNKTWREYFFSINWKKKILMNLFVFSDFFPPNITPLKLKEKIESPYYVQLIPPTTIKYLDISTWNKFEKENIFQYFPSTIRKIKVNEFPQVNELVSFKNSNLQIVNIKKWLFNSELFIAASSKKKKGFRNCWIIIEEWG